MAFPDQKQNRVPVRNEAIALRTLATKTSEMIQQLIAERTTAQNALDDIAQRYEEQNFILKSIESERYHTQQILNAVISNEKTLRDKSADLRGLLHPVRRCPSEVIMQSFEMTVDHVYGRSRKFQQSLRLSHVCQSWRHVTLQMHSLWDQRTITFKHTRSTISEIMSFSSDISRKKPISLRIIDIGTSNFAFGHQSWSLDIREKLNLCHISDYEFISTLRLATPPQIPISIALSYMTSFPEAKLECLEIAREEGPWSIDADEEWDFSTFLHCFPPFHSLTLENIYCCRIQSKLVLPSVRTLTALDLEMFPILDLLAMLPNLLDLVFRGGLYYFDSISRPNYHTSLRSLTFHDNGQGDTANIPWGRLPTCSHLTHLIMHSKVANTYDVSPDLLAFIVRCGGISHVTIDIDLLPRDFFTAATSLSSLRIRFTGNSLFGYSSGVEDASDTLFPNLDVLHLVFGADDTRLTVAQFNTIVTKRCLPHTHPDFAGSFTQAAITTLIISESDEVPGGWRLCSLAKSTVIVEGVDTMHNHESMCKMTWV